MILKEGVKIYTKLPIEGRILLSSGIERATTINGIPCHHKAYIPKLPWRVATKEEIKLLVAYDKKSDLGSTVGIIRLPSLIRNLFKKSNVQSASSKRNLGTLSSSTEFNKALESLLQFVELFQSNNDTPILHSVGQGPAGLPNSSYDFKNGIYPGLHVDSWEMKVLSERHLSRNRVLINLGKDPRYFMFINLEMQNIKKYISAGNLSSENTMFADIDRFFEENSNYPVVKIKLNPFEGYIAPTDNIIHDGNTEGQEAMDIFFTLRSYYSCYSKLSFSNPLKRLFHF